jgi:hypothetical protein
MSCSDVLGVPYVFNNETKVAIWIFEIQCIYNKPYE